MLVDSRQGLLALRRQDGGGDEGSHPTSIGWAVEVVPATLFLGGIVSLLGFCGFFLIFIKAEVIIS